MGRARGEEVYKDWLVGLECRAKVRKKAEVIGRGQIIQTLQVEHPRFVIQTREPERERGTVNNYVKTAYLNWGCSWPVGYYTNLDRKFEFLSVVGVIGEC